MSEQRITLSDRSVQQLSLSKTRYIVRDVDLKGFFVVVGAKTKTYTVQAEYWIDGQRHGKRLAVGQAGDVSARDARIKAKALLAQIASGELHQAEEAATAAPEPTPEPEAPKGITLREAWGRYRTAHMERKGRSPATIAGYADHVERLLADWQDQALQVLGDKPSLVAERHDKLSVENGPAIANGTMRTLRAIYNHARRSHRELPPENPTTAVDWNKEKRRNTAMGAADLPAWFDQARALRNVVRREFHLFTLLSGSRPGALRQARLDHLNFRDRILHLPRPKGGEERAFDIPLSRAMIRCLIRVIRAGRMLQPEQAREWVFVAESEEGHLHEHKEDRSDLAKWGNDLRQTYRTLGQAAGASELDMHLLMNHVVQGVNPNYITREKLLSDHLRGCQEKVSNFMLAASGRDPLRPLAWPFLPSRRIGDALLDPTPPDPRSNEARSLTIASPRGREPSDNVVAIKAMREAPSVVTWPQAQPQPSPSNPDPVRFLLSM